MTHPNEMPVKVEPEDLAHAVEATLDPKIQEALGRSLKAHYDDLVKAPIPDRFLVLLAELEAKEQHHGK